jgi:hypothetical protein
MPPVVGKGSVRAKKSTSDVSLMTTAHQQEHIADVLDIRDSKQKMARNAA